MTGILDEFIATAAELKRRTVTEVGKTLKEQMVRAEKDLRDAEVALERFRVNTIMLPSENTPGTGGGALSQPGDRWLLRDTARIRQRAARSASGGDHARRRSGGFTRSECALVRFGGRERCAANTSRGADELSTKQTELRAAQRTYTDKHPVRQRAQE